MTYIARTFLAYLFIIFATAAAQSQGFDKLQRLSTRQLTIAGNDYINKHNDPQNALLYFSIATNRYNKNMPIDEKKRLIGAYFGKWYVYFFYFFDYQQAAETLRQAAELCDETRHSKAKLYLNYGTMYQTLSEQCNDMKLKKQAFDYYVKSFDDALKGGQNDIMFNSFGNMVQIAHACGNVKLVSRQKAIVDSIARHSKDKIFAYDNLLYKAFISFESGDYAEALHLFKTQLKLIDEKKDYIRYRYVALTNISKTKNKMGDIDGAITTMKEANRLALKFDMKDAKLESYYSLATLYAQAGMNDEKDRCRNKYFMLKDTLLNYRQLASVNEIKFLETIKNFDKRMEQMKKNDERKNMAIATVAIFVVVVTAFLIVIFHKNKKLRHNNDMLYKQNVELLKAEDERRRQRLENKTQNGQYVTSPLDSDSKDILAAKIVDILELSDEIYSPDFSGNRLAEMTGTKYNYVSQVINQVFGCNFKTLLNKYRIKEACRRINDKKYANLTIEAIANSVGFHSPNGFRTQFKNETGLSPSEYKRIANTGAMSQKRNEPDGSLDLQ